MAIPNRQIGWSNKANLLWQISKQLERLINVTAQGNTYPTTTTTTTAAPTTTTTTVAPTTTTTTTTCSYVFIGGQEWKSCNLNVARYANGDEIPQVTDPTAWAALTTGAWCYYNNDPANEAVYGKLYNWYAVNDIRGLAPAGTHIPTDDEWTTLTTFLGGEPVAGGKMKSTGTTLWQSPNTAATNESGFTGLPAGFRDPNGTFINIGLNGFWWSSSEYITSDAWSRFVNYNYGFASRNNFNKKLGFSVRCLGNIK
tara:strand:+ start:709 stop:1473 length:765 start_codon:yes stop_codon:yes gene_type:complete